MKNLSKAILLISSSIFSHTLARNVNFSVISFGSTVNVNINGSSVPMTKVENNVPLWKVTANQIDDGDITYKYVTDGVEDIERTLKSGVTETYNELIGRAMTTFDMLQFNYPEADKWTRSIGKTKLFDDSYIPTFIFSDPGSFFSNPSGSFTFPKVTVIMKDEYKVFSNVETSSKNHDEDKFQFQIHLPNGGIYNRDFLKFRPSAYDPVFFRQIMYGDILHAIGCPAHESIATRVYQDNGTGIGLYVLQESTPSDSFIRTAFFGNESDGTVQTMEYGPIYDCGTSADFTPVNNNDLGDFINEKDMGDMKTDLLTMVTKVYNANVNDEASVKDINENWLDLNTLFKALALEYLAGHWDSYWFFATNFVTYHPVDLTAGAPFSYTKLKYYFIDQDFDQTWGINIKPELEPKEFPKRSYKSYVKLDWANLYPISDPQSPRSQSPPNRVIIDKYIGCDSNDQSTAKCITKTMFEDQLKNIVKHVFNPNALGNKIDSYVKRLRPEIVWDTQEIERLHKGTTQQYHLTVEQFDGNIESGNFVGSQYDWGLKDWTKTMADNVCKEFGIDYNEAVLKNQEGKTVEASNTTSGASHHNSLSKIFTTASLFVLGYLLF